MKAWFLLVLALVGGLLAWVLWPSARAVQVATVERRALNQSLDEDGLVRSWVEVNVAPQVGGRLARIYVERGRKAQKGQLLAELEAAEQRAALDQLRAQESAAAHAVEQARRQLRLTDARVQAELEVAAAGLRLARAQQLKVVEGPRPEQKAALRAVYERARLRLEETRRDYQRRQSLYQQGAVSRADLESFEAAYNSALFAMREAQARWSEARRGPVASERGVAQAEVDRSAATLRTGTAQLAQAEVAEAGLQEAAQRLEVARAQVRQAEEKLRQLKLVAPVTGVVEWEDVEPGEIVTPGQIVLRLSDPRRIYVELLLDEGDRALARVGTPVEITSDAYPGQIFRGKLEAIETQAFLKRQVRNSPTQDEDRVFRSRVRLEGGEGRLFPGMSVFAQVLLGQPEEVLTIPRQACINREGEWVAFRVSGGRAHRQVIELGKKDNTRVEVVKGLQEGQSVLLNPGSVSDGALVRVEK